MLLTFIACFLLVGCYPKINCTVVDADTGEPIEGAVVLVEWTKTHGIGLTWTESVKVFEGVTDKYGRITIPGTIRPFVNSPDVTVYKKDYVGWSSQFVFPDFSRREDFNWKDGFIFQLSRFNCENDRNSHVRFLHLSIGVLNFDKKEIINDAIEWEERINSGKVIEKKEKR